MVPGRSWCHDEGRLRSSHLDGFQLLRSSSVAVSTSQDFEDKAAITWFCRQEERKYNLWIQHVVCSMKLTGTGGKRFFLKGREVGLCVHTMCQTCDKTWNICHDCWTMTTMIHFFYMIQPNPHPQYYKHCDETKSETGSDLIEAHGEQFVYFTCVVGTRDGSACIDVRPQPCSLFEHFLVLLILRMQRESTVSSVNDMKTIIQRMCYACFLG